MPVAALVAAGLGSQVGLLRFDTFCFFDVCSYLMFQWPRPRRWILTIPLIDQWLAKIENHCKNHWRWWYFEKISLWSAATLLCWSLKEKIQNWCLLCNKLHILLFIVCNQPSGSTAGAWAGACAWELEAKVPENILLHIWPHTATMCTCNLCIFVCILCICIVHVPPHKLVHGNCWKVEKT